uniref:Myosinlike protein putative n=1 Tax=Albugo laibachii Nc14 TaxID=890382 RepID=F0WS62_9STRA|nr:myosinlike protein putative [Albugo laibachii Nc14]|eukprot:CCA24180.1 myosinlike protein putative [Albugo laibachii Nc14]
MSNFRPSQSSNSLDINRSHGSSSPGLHRLNTVPRPRHSSRADQSDYQTQNHTRTSLVGQSGGNNMLAASTSRSINVASSLPGRNDDFNAHSPSYSQRQIPMGHSPLTNKPKKRSQGNGPAGQPPIAHANVESRLGVVEEGDYIWVSDSNGTLENAHHSIESDAGVTQRKEGVIPAVVVRVGYMYDPVTEHEKPVITVHTEDGDEREIRGLDFVRLPLCHHPKTVPSRSIQDLSSLPLMTTNGASEKNEVFSQKQLESILLYTLRARYRIDQIYTWVDRVLISINPVTSLPIYTPISMKDIMQQQQQLDLTMTSAGSLASSAVGFPAKSFGSSHASSSSTTYPMGAPKTMLQNIVPPHVFAMAHNAFRFMQDTGEDQAIILVGTVGSGKSEAAKLIVQYLCEYGEETETADSVAEGTEIPDLPLSASRRSYDTQRNTSPTPLQPDSLSANVAAHSIGQQILHAFTILESFGNAATRQNRNSSRFAKMISVEFNKHRHLIGGGFTIHYFEKSRVIEPRYDERNFHVFYQVLAGVQHDPSLREQLELNNKCANDFVMLKNMADLAGSFPSFTAAPGGDASIDARDYRDLMSSFSVLRIRKSQRLEITRIIAGLLHLGNVEFVPDTTTSSEEGSTTDQTYGSNRNTGRRDSVSHSASCVLKDPAQITLVAHLLDVEPVVLDNYFRTRQFFSRDENNKAISSLKVVTVSQANKARDTFVRSVYESLFHFMVETLNGFLGGVFDRYANSNLVIQSQGIHILDTIGHEDITSEIVYPSGSPSILSGSSGDINLRASGSGPIHSSLHNTALQFNGFEQLCANYWSEKVHHFYLINTLSPLEAFATTKSRSSSMKSGSFSGRLSDNTIALNHDENKCLDIMEHPTLGLFVLLRDHCKTRLPDEEEFISNLLAVNDETRVLTRPTNSEYLGSRISNPRDWNLLFTIEHYHGKILYSGKSFSSKNMLTVSATCAAIMHSSKNGVLHAVGAAQIAANQAAAGASSTEEIGRRPDGRKRNASGKTASRKRQSTNITKGTALEMQTQSDALLQALNHTGKNFLVCLKPNTTLEQGHFHSGYVAEQLRMMRIVDLMRASRSVFSVQLSFSHFIRRYKNICGHRGTFESLLRSLSAIGVLEDDFYRISAAPQRLSESSNAVEASMKANKIFLTSHQWKKLEQARDIYLNACATMIQRSLLHGVFRKKALQIRLSMQCLRSGMEKRDAIEIFTSIQKCQELLAPNLTFQSMRNKQQPLQYIRVLNDARALVTVLEEEEYVQSLVNDLIRTSELHERSSPEAIASKGFKVHPVLVDYVIRIAESYYPSMNTGHLRKLRSHRTGFLDEKHAEEERSHKHNKAQQEIRKQLWDGILRKDVEALMGTLALLNESTKDIKEQKLATIVVIRALEEKGAVEALMKTLEAVNKAISVVSDQSADEAIQTLLSPLKNVLEKGLESRCPQVEEFVRSAIDATKAATPLPSTDAIATGGNTRSAHPTVLSTEKLSLLRAALERSMEEGNWIATKKILERIGSLGDQAIAQLGHELVQNARDNLAHGLSALSFHAERNQSIKFLAIARTCGDITLLNSAISTAIEGGIATWDFNLKNALKQRDDLQKAEKAEDKSDTILGAGPIMVEQQHLPSSLEMLLQIWTAGNNDDVVYLLDLAPGDSIAELIAAKVKHQDKIKALSRDLELAWNGIDNNEADLAMIEKLVQRSLTFGCDDDTYVRIIDFYHESQLSTMSEKLEENETTKVTANLESWIHDSDDAFAATILFLESRLARRAEIREDAIEFLTTKYEELTSARGDNDPWQNFPATEREELIRRIARLQRALRNAVTARSRLETQLLVPIEILSVGSLTSALEAARSAGVQTRLIDLAAVKLDAAMMYRRGEQRHAHSHESLTATSTAGTCGSHVHQEDEKVLSQSYGPSTEGSDTISRGNDEEDETGDPSEPIVANLNEGQATDYGNDSIRKERDAFAFFHYPRLQRLGLTNQTSDDENPQLVKLYWSLAPLRRSLLILNENISHSSWIPHASNLAVGRNDSSGAHSLGRLSELAIGINRCILGYMRDRVVLYRDMLAQFILQLGVEELGALVDEVYIQLMKQLTKNPKRDSSLRGWALLAMCTTSFLPSNALQEYVLRFLNAPRPNSNSFWRILNGVASYCSKRLEALISNGATGFIPNMDEIQAYDSRLPFLASSIELLDGTVLAEAFPVTPEMTVEHLIEICAHFLGLDDRLAQFLGIVTIPANTGSTEQNSSSSSFQRIVALPIFLEPDEFLGDIFEREALRGRDFKFVLKIRILIPPRYALHQTGASFLFKDELFNRLTYIQAIDDILSGVVPLEEEESVARLAAYAIAIDRGGPARCECSRGTDEEIVCMAFHSSDDVAHEVSISEYVPYVWWRTKSESQWSNVIFDALQDIVNPTNGELEVATLQDMFVNEIQLNRLYGAVIFQCKLAVEYFDPAIVLSSSDRGSINRTSAISRSRVRKESMNRESCRSTKILGEDEEAGEDGETSQDDDQEIKRVARSQSISQQYTARSSQLPLLGSGKKNQKASASSIRLRTRHWLGADLPGYFALALNIHGIHFLGRDGSILATCCIGDVVAAYGTAHRFVLSIMRSGITKEPEHLYITTRYVDVIRRFLFDFRELEGVLTAATATTTID